MGCDIVTVSTDTQFTHLAWQRSEKELANVKYTMGADPTAKVSRMFGVYNEDNGLDLRGSFLIDPELQVEGRGRQDAGEPRRQDGWQSPRGVAGRLSTFDCPRGRD